MTTIAKQSLKTQITELDNRFWVVNTMEMIERLAYYGVRAVIALYMVLALEEGGPEFSHVQKGAIFASWAAVQSLVPMFTGGVADRFGHKLTISIAIVFKIIGYLFMAWFLSYGGFWLGCMLLAFGTAIFKPGVQGTLAATLKKSSASVGWSIFYQLVNIGGFLGPVIAGALRQWSWSYVFYGCAVIVAANFLWLPFYDDPSKDPEFASDKSQKEAWGSLSRSLTKTLVSGWTQVLVVLSLLTGLLPVIWGGALLASGVTITASELGVESLGLGGPVVLLGWTGTILVTSLLALVFGNNDGLKRIAWMPMTIAAILAWTGPGLDGVGLSAAISAKAYASGPVAFLASVAGKFIALGKYPTVLAAAFLAYHPRKSEYDEGQADLVSVVVVSIVGLFQHRVFWFCIVFSGFWVMFNQVFDLLPNMIDDWVDSSQVIGFLGAQFATPLVPTLLAVFLGLVAGFVLAGINLLATRPDQRKAADVPWNAFMVVAIAWFAVGLFAALALDLPQPAAIACGIALLVGVGGFFAKLPGKALAAVAAVIGGLGAAFTVRAGLLANAAELTKMADEGAQVPPEWMINMNPGLIVFTVVFFGYLSSFVRPLTSIIIGMVVATAGSIVAGTAVIGWSCLAGICIFSIGEMLSSPKKMEYLASLAKKGQEGLFMGYANVPVAIGWIAGSIVAGAAYEEHGDKVVLARRHLVDVLGEDGTAIEALKKTEVMPMLADKLGGSLMDAQTLLYQTYHPEKIWLGIGLTGLASIIGMIIYDRVLRSIDAKAEA